MEVIKEYKGYRYITLTIEFSGFFSHVCGYVEIPEGHYLFKKKINEPIPELAEFNDEILNGEVGERGCLSLFANSLRENTEPLAMDIIFDVHGSITYSWRVFNFEKERKQLFDWAVGFDTCHYNDDETTQTHGFCEWECKKLIDQIVKFDEKIKDSKNEKD